MGTVPYSLIQEFFTTSMEFAAFFFLSRKFKGDVTFLTTIKNKSSLKSLEKENRNLD